MSTIFIKVPNIYNLYVTRQDAIAVISSYTIYWKLSARVSEQDNHRIYTCDLILNLLSSFCFAKILVLMIVLDYKLKIGVGVQK